jgi:tRNA A-37 threonylcarbamoyl transferase component Bud32/tetratricopeptide (TPR) repeat protein
VGVDKETDPFIGRKIRGSFEIRRRIGEGGMGCVYEGYQLVLDRSVAIKVMSAENARNPIAAEYFLREARSVSKLRHPHIIQILDFGQEDDETYFIAMEFVPGEPLSKLMAREGLLDASRVRSIVDQTLDALEEAHANKIIHRDLKPDNLMVERTRDGGDFVKILDFGIAHVQGASAQAGPMTVQGLVVGTPHYMSPEQARGKRVDQRSDLFSMGAILYELLTGHVPFDGESMAELLTAVIRDEVVQPSARFPALLIDPELEAVCLRALHKDPELRYQSAAQMRAALAPRVARAAAFKPAPRARQREREPAHTPMPAYAPTVQAPRPLVEQPEPAPVAVAPLAQLDTASLRQELVGERRHGVVLTLHQRTRGAVDAEALATLYGQLDDALELLATQTAATFQGRQGGWSTLIFGAGERHRGGALSGAQAALALQQAVQRLALPGIFFGLALSDGELFCPGGDVRRAAGAAIDAALEGARSAADGEILVLGEALRADLAPHMALLPSDTPGAHVLSGPLDGAHAAQELSSRSLQERDMEMASALGAIQQLTRKKGAVLVVHGAPGAGTTAMLGAIAELARQRKALVLEASMRLPHQLGLHDVIRQWLASALRARGVALDEAQRGFEALGLPPLMAALLGRHVAQRQLELQIGMDSTTSGASADRALHAALRHLGRALAAQAPLVLALDDVDQLDAPLLDLLHTWSALAQEQPILVAVALRRATLGRVADRLPEGVLALPISPLSEEAAMTFVRVHGPRGMAEQAQRALVRLSGGLPRHLSDLVHHVRMYPTEGLEELERGMLRSRELRDMLALRLYGQPRSGQYTLGLLSILGDGARRSAVRALAQPDWSADASLDTAIQDGLLVGEERGEDEALYFRPPALGRVIYETLALKGRQRVHAQAAAYYAAIRGPDEDALRAWSRQLEGVGDVPGALAVLDRLIALERRAGQAALVEADQRAALVMLSGYADATPADIAQRQLRLAEALHAQGRDQEALALCARLEREAGLPDALRHEVQLAHAAFWLETEDPGPLEQLLSRVSAELAADAASPPWLRVRALYLLAFVQDKLGRGAAAARSALDAIELLQRHALGAQGHPLGASLLWEPLWLLARLKLQQRDLEGARSLSVMALTIAQDHHELRGQIMLHDLSGQLAAMQGRVDEAQASLERALALAREGSDLRLCARVLHNIGALQLGMGRADLARRSLEASLELASDLDWREGVAMVTAKLHGLSARG